MDLTGRPSPGARFVGKPPLARAWAAVAIATVLLLIFALDLATGSAPVQHLYYLPIIFAAVRFRMRGGLATAGAAIVFYHLANPHFLSLQYSESDILQTAVFIAVGASSAKLARTPRRLHHLPMAADPPRLA